MPRVIRDAFYESKGAHALHFVDADGNPELSRTKQADKDQTDIHKILDRYNRTGLVDHVAKGVAQYGDFTNVNEYQEALNITLRAQQSFAGLPAKVRAKFGNDPGAFFEFATNPENHEKLVEMGLANAPAPASSPVRVEVVNNSGGQAAEGPGTVST